MLRRLWAARSWFAEFRLPASPDDYLHPAPPQVRWNTQVRWLKSHIYVNNQSKGWHGKYDGYVAQINDIRWFTWWVFIHDVRNDQDYINRSVKKYLYLKYIMVTRGEGGGLLPLSSIQNSRRVVGGRRVWKHESSTNLWTSSVYSPIFIIQGQILGFY